jgi:regulation of enolase protein 1 (concanavalin A-like superfamily)
MSSTPSGTLLVSNQTADPMFTSASSPYDFRPKTGSPALNTGVTLVEVAKDIDGTNRNDGLYDLGAYEAGSGGGGGSQVPPTAAAPTITPGGGTLSAPTAVTLATTTAGATIRYTMDGTTPSSSSTAYSGPLTVGSTLTIKAQAFAHGMIASPVTQASFQYAAAAAPGTGTLPSGWKTEDIGSVSQPGSASESGGLFTMQSGGADIWNTADGFRYAYLPLPGDGAIVARVASVQNVNVWTKAGVMIRQTLDATSAHASLFVTPGNGISFQRRPTTGGTSLATTAAGAAPRWVRVTRAGQLFTAAVSTDGSAWTTVGQETIAMSGTVWAGLALTSHDVSRLATATLDRVSLAAGPGTISSWQSTDVGSVGLQGSSSSSGTAFTVFGSGTDIWGTADAFRFVYRTLNGDGELVARVTGIENVDPWSKAGVMVRGSLNPNAPYAYMLISAASGGAFQWRSAAGAAAADTSSGGSTAVAPRWVKIVRAGNVLSGYQSTDGVSWTSVGTATISMGTSVTIGLAVTSHDNTKLARGTFESVALK